jgi:transcriptional regulator with PAS, ATPase and Fis domain
MANDSPRDVKDILLDNAHEGLIICDASGKILYFNRPYGEIYNMNRVSDIGKDIKEFFPDARMPLIAKTGVAEYGVIYKWKGQDLVVNRVPIKDGSRVKWVINHVMFRNIKELKDLNEKVANLKVKIDSMSVELRNFFQAKYSIDDIIGESYQMKQLKRLAAKYASTSLPILILGESGTGKELFAQAIHLMSPRAKRAFLAINCAAIPKELIESELFGYEEGAFTGATQRGKIGKFEMVEGGTFFLDEIGDMPLEMQAKLLRVLEEKQITRLGGDKAIPVEFSLVASTNRNIREMVEKDAFRSDLFYRINAFVLEIPPLRERRNDIIPIAKHIIASSRNPGSKKIVLSHSSKSLLMQHEWPGNVREVSNVVNFAMHNLLYDETTIEPRHFPPSLFIRNENHDFKNSSLSLKKSLEVKEMEIIRETLISINGNKAAAARLLGISRCVFYNKLRKHKFLR